MDKRFVGRTIFIEQIDNCFSRNSTTASETEILLINGLGGVGKTQLALRYAQIYHERYPNAAVLWIDATTTQSIRASFLEYAQRLMQDYSLFNESLGLSEVARCLGLEGIVNEAGDINSDPGDERTTDLVIKSVNEWLTCERNEKWLIIFDNVNETSHVTSLFPERITGNIILTSRERLPLRLARSKVLTLSPMEKEESIDLFLTVSCGKNFTLSFDGMFWVPKTSNCLTYD
jgi:Cdc6-like AAA superfamily ATPase